MASLPHQNQHGPENIFFSNLGISFLHENPKFQVFMLVFVGGCKHLCLNECPLYNPELLFSFNARHGSGS